MFNFDLEKPKNQKTAAKINAKTTTPKLPRNLASQTIKNESTSSKKWLQNASKKNAMLTASMTNAKINARITTE